MISPRLLSAGSGRFSCNRASRTDVFLCVPRLPLNVGVRAPQFAQLLGAGHPGTMAPWQPGTPISAKKKNERLYTVISTPFNVRCHLCQRYAPSFIIFHAVCTYQFKQFGLRKRKPSRSISRFPSLAAVFSSPPKYLV